MIGGRDWKFNKGNHQITLWANQIILKAFSTCWKLFGSHVRPVMEIPLGWSTKETSSWKVFYLYKVTVNEHYQCNFSTFFQIWKQCKKAWKMKFCSQGLDKHDVDMGFPTAIELHVNTVNGRNSPMGDNYWCIVPLISFGPSGSSLYPHMIHLQIFNCNIHPWVVVSHLLCT